MNSETIFSIVILTFNREEYLKKQLPLLSSLDNCEVIIVDNHSEDKYSERLAKDFNNVSVIRLDRNYGAVGRNFGMQAAKGKYLITLDDDVWGITNQDLDKISTLFQDMEDVHGICFKVLDEKDHSVTNWCHHRDPDIYSDQAFETYQISEGAVAFRRALFDEIGFYPIEFFISHEGPDLAYRMLKAKKRIVYEPTIQVIHAHALEGRKSWRRYYFDTRNLIWLAYRHYNLQMLLFLFPVQILAMFIYSVRDGFARYFIRAVKDALSGLAVYRGSRSPINKETHARIKSLDTHKPPLSFYIKRRLLRKGVKI